MKAESAFGVVENELRECRELKKETVELQGAVVDDVMGGVAEPVVREVLVGSVNKVEGCDQKSTLRVRRADQTFVAAQGGVPPNVPRVRSANQPEEVASVDKVAKDAQVVQAGSVVLAHAEEGPPADIDVLYHTLVRDGALPRGFEREFATLATVITAAAERERRRMANFGNVEAAFWLHEREKRKLVVELNSIGQPRSDRGSTGRG